MFDKNKNENKLPFLIAKSEANETLNWLDELLSCENFSEEQVEEVDSLMKQIGDIDDDTASAIADLLLAVTSEQEIAKNCETGNWPSITGQEQVELLCLVKKSGELNDVEVFIQKFATKAEMEDSEIFVISKALEVISDLDDDSLNAVLRLLKIEFSETTITKRWPSLFKHTETNQAEAEQPVAKKKFGLRWPTIRNCFTGMIQKENSRDVLNPLTGSYRKPDDNEVSKSDEPKWPSISG